MPLGQITADDNDRAAKEISPRRGAPAARSMADDLRSRSTRSTSQTPTSYWWDRATSPTSTSSVAGKHPDHRFHRSGHTGRWSGTRSHGLPSWAEPDYTWAPAVAAIGGSYLLYYVADVAGSGRECISVATATGAPGAVRRPLDGATGVPPELAVPSTRLRSPTPTEPVPPWKSGVRARPRSGRSSSADRTAFAAGATPSCCSPRRRPWEAGTVEAPDMVTTGGRYFLFFSGNNGTPPITAWGSPCGAGRSDLQRPCHRPPSSRAARRVAGPGGETVFADTTGTYWIAFHASVPGAVGFPNSRDCTSAASMSRHGARRRRGRLNGKASRWRQSRRTGRLEVELRRSLWLTEGLVRDTASRQSAAVTAASPPPSARSNASCAARCSANAKSAGRETLGALRHVLGVTRTQELPRQLLRPSRSGAPTGMMRSNRRAATWPGRWRRWSSSP